MILTANQVNVYHSNQSFICHGTQQFDI